MPDNIWEEIASHLAIYTTAGTALMGFVILMWKKVIKPTIDVYSNWKLALEKIEKIFFEVTPNGGTSIKDAIRRIELETALSRERFKAMYAESTAAVFEANTEGQFIWVNRTFCRLTERSPDQLLGSGWHNAICPKYKEDSICEWDKSIKENREMSGHVTEFITSQGQCIEIMCSSYKMRDYRGNTIGFIGICRPLGPKHESCQTT